MKAVPGFVILREPQESSGFGTGLDRRPDGLDGARCRA